MPQILIDKKLGRADIINSPRSNPGLEQYDYSVFKDNPDYQIVEITDKEVEDLYAVDSGDLANAFLQGVDPRPDTGVSSAAEKGVAALGGAARDLALKAGIGYASRGKLSKLADPAVDISMGAIQGKLDPESSAGAGALEAGVGNLIGGAVTGMLKRIAPTDTISKWTRKILGPKHDAPNIRAEPAPIDPISRLAPVPSPDDLALVKPPGYVADKYAKKKLLDEKIAARQEILDEARKKEQAIIEDKRNARLSAVEATGEGTLSSVGAEYAHRPAVDSLDQLRDPALKNKLLSDVTPAEMWSAVKRAWGILSSGDREPTQEEIMELATKLVEKEKAGSTKQSLPELKSSQKQERGPKY